ncbi:hypothetical protein [Streptomyces sp. NPDC059918]|uniref:hypothetical protein n=1 Tax=unclassified Streptomyces TaxID=2593676 RepID=UPI00365B0934
MEQAPQHYYETYWESPPDDEGQAPIDADLFDWAANKATFLAAIEDFSRTAGLPEALKDDLQAAAVMLQPDLPRWNAQGLLARTYHGAVAWTNDGADAAGVRAADDYLVAAYPVLYAWATPMQDKYKGEDTQDNVVRAENPVVPEDAPIRTMYVREADVHEVVVVAGTPTVQGQEPEGWYGYAVPPAGEGLYVFKQSYALVLKDGASEWEPWSWNSPEDLAKEVASGTVAIKTMQHSSIFGGDRLLCAGLLRFADDEGQLCVTELDGASGHYKPVPGQLGNLALLLESLGIRTTRTSTTVPGIGAAHGVGERERAQQKEVLEAAAREGFDKAATDIKERKAPLAVFVRMSYKQLFQKIVLAEETASLTTPLRERNRRGVEAWLNGAAVDPGQFAESMRRLPPRAYREFFSRLDQEDHVALAEFLAGAYEGLDVKGLSPETDWPQDRVFKGGALDDLEPLDEGLRTRLLGAFEAVWDASMVPEESVRAAKAKADDRTARRRPGTHPGSTSSDSDSDSGTRSLDDEESESENEDESGGELTGTGY